MNRRRFLALSTAAAGSALGLDAHLLLAQPRRPMRDIVVLLPGIMGSVLQQGGQDVWALSGSALLSGLASLGRSVSNLALRRDPPDADDVGDGVVATRLFSDLHLVPGLWKIDGYTQVARAITQEFDLRPRANYFEFPYDWRRDNRVAARRLARESVQWLKAWRQTSGNQDAKLILIAHSMGGLVSRYFLEVLGGWRDTRMLITFGTPYRGSLNALGFLANGMKGSLGPLTVDVTDLVRSFTSVYQLLPTYPCYDPGSGELQRVAEASGIPNVDSRRARAAFEFHEEIRQSSEKNAKIDAYLSGRYTLHPVVGTYQQTLQTARRAGSALIMSERHPQADIRGDGTVPRASATPIEPPVLESRQRPVFVAEVHGSIQNSRTVLEHVRALLAEGAIAWDVFRAPTTNAIALAVDDLYGTEDQIRVKISCDENGSLLIVSIADVQTGRDVMRMPVDGVGVLTQTIDCGRLPEGAYRVSVAGATGGSASDVFLVSRPL